MENVDKLHNREPLPMEDVLQLLGFERNELGGYEKSWGRLTVTGVEWLNLWHFWCLWSSERTLGYPEFRVPNRIAPVKLLAVLYQLCRDAFHDAEFPEVFEVGKQEFEEQRRLRDIIPPPPTVWADSKFLRFCLTYVERGDDWSSYDYPICFSVEDGQLKIKSKSSTVFCPARGGWLGSSVVQAREFYRRLPKRFMSDVVTLQQHGKSLHVGSHVIPAHWVEEAH